MLAPHWISWILVLLGSVGLGGCLGVWGVRCHRERISLKAAVQAIGLGVCLRDKNGRITHVNTHLRQILGLSPEVPDEAWLEALPAEVYQKLLQQFSSPEHVSVQNDFCMESAAGIVRWIRICHASLGLGRLIITLEDVTLRSRAEQDKRESEERFAQMFYLLPVLATISEVDTGRFIDVNHQWERMMGFSREEAIGHTSGELELWLKMEDRQNLVAAVVRDGAIRDYSMQTRTKSGRIIDSYTSGSLISLHGKRYLMLIVRDVTEELATARALRESEIKFSTIFRESLAALVLSEADTGMILDANHAWLSMVGRSREDLVGYASMATGIWVDHQERTSIVEQVLANGGVTRVECHLRTGAGAIRLCLGSCRELMLNGRRCLIWCLQDISEQRAMEQEIQHMNANLETKVRERTAELERANRELQEVLSTLRCAQDELVRAEKLAALGGLVAGVAHELNTPIGNCVTAASAIQWQTEQIRTEMADGTIRRSLLADYLEYVDTGGELLMRNLEQARDLVMSFKQVAVDRASDQRRKFDLASLVQEILKMHHAVVRHSRCSVEITVDVESGIVLDSFPGSLGQVLSNFIANALLHAFDGRERGHIAICALREGEETIAIRFEDDGVGIHSENLKRIFDPFYTTKFGRGGSGLGLHIVYNIVNNVLGGSIHVTSMPGEGTRFELCIPLQAPDGPTINPMHVPSVSVARDAFIGAAVGEGQGG